MPNPDFYVNEHALFGNSFSFKSFPLTRELTDAVDAVIMGVPYDMGTCGRSGTRFGPTGIRQASGNLRWEEKRWPWDFALNDKLNVIDYGDIISNTGDSADMVEQVTTAADTIVAAGKTLITLGGDHFVTLPLLRAVAKHHGKLALLHFDAHTDTEESDLAYNHGSMFYRAPKEGLIDPSQSIQIGIRTHHWHGDDSFTVLDAAWSNDHSVEDIVARIRETVGNMPIYLSFDIDCLDPAFAPGTGTPVVGGLTTDKALKIIRTLKGFNIVAMDLMEVAPAYDHADITSLAGATLVLEMLYMLAATRSV